MKKRLFWMPIVLVIGMLSGCVSTANKLITKSDLHTSTQMSETIWLDPAKTSYYNSLYLQVRNTSNQNVHVKNALVSTLTNLGYRVESDPSLA